MRFVSSISRENQLFWDVEVKWQNKGNTPAQAASSRIDYVILDSPIGEDFPNPRQEFYNSQASIDQRDGTMVTRLGQVRGSDLKAVQLGKKHFYLIGELHYDDVFDNTPSHVTSVFIEIMRVFGDPGKIYNKDKNVVSVNWKYIGNKNFSK